MMARKRLLWFFRVCTPLLLLSHGSEAAVPTPLATDAPHLAEAPLSAEAQCRQDLSKFPGHFDPALADDACRDAVVPPECASVNGTPIYRIDRPPRAGKVGAAKRILVFALTHGDEPQSGSLARSWLARLSDLDHRSHWMFVPVVNPDGWAKKTRENANGVDLNRNFPTFDWDQKAHLFWKKITGANARRYPGTSAASEPETRCAVRVIQEFKPELIVSIHTPYGLLDFDGPRTHLPKVPRHPAKRLGNFPGSLGRYMWADRNIPVLTIELHAGSAPLTASAINDLQDSIGSLALRISR